MVELGLGRLRYWLLPSQWTRLFALMQYEQSCIARKKLVNKLPVIRVKIPGFEEETESKQAGSWCDAFDGLKEVDANLSKGVFDVKVSQANGDSSQEPFLADTVDVSKAAAALEVAEAANTSEGAHPKPSTAGDPPASTDCAPGTPAAHVFERGQHEVRVVVRRRMQRSSRGEAIDASTVNVDVVDDCGGMHRLRLPLRLMRSHSPGIEDLSTAEHVSELVRWLAYRDIGTLDAAATADGDGTNTKEMVHPELSGEAFPAREPNRVANNVRAKSKVLVFLPLFEAQEYAAAMAVSAAAAAPSDPNSPTIISALISPEQQQLAQFQNVSPLSRPPSAGPVAVFGDELGPSVDEPELSCKDRGATHDAMAQVLEKEEAKNKEEVAEALAVIKEAGVSVPTSPISVDGKELRASFGNDLVAAMFIDAAVSIDAKTAKAADVVAPVTGGEETNTDGATPGMPDGKVEATKKLKRKKKKKIFPHHAHTGGNGSIGFAAFATVLRNPELVAARWELATRLLRRRVIYEEARSKANGYVAAAVNRVDPPAARKRRAKDAKAARLAARNNMIRAAVALIEAVNARSELESAQQGKKKEDGEAVDVDRQGLNVIEPEEGEDSKEGGAGNAAEASTTTSCAITTKLLEQEEDGLVEMVDTVTTTRAKLLHFLAVARLPKAALAQNYELLKPMLASSDGAGGFAALHPNVVKSLMVGAPEDVVAARAILPTLGFDPRNDVRTLERLPEFAKAAEEGTAEK